MNKKQYYLNDKNTLFGQKYNFSLYNIFIISLSFFTEYQSSAFAT